ncbi:MAG: PAS domain S-box protein, partial [Deltaproteobacteria bacterium]|nr:PAS domain S-box protein [Deltaproteobacteria bacterium]
MPFPSRWGSWLERKGSFIAHSIRSKAYQRVNVRHLKGISQALSGIEGNYRIREGGRDIFMSVAIVPGIGWPVMVHQTEEQAFAPVHRVRLIFWIGLGLALILALVLALLRGKRLLRPLSLLISDARSMARGDYDLPPRPRTYPEIDELSEDIRAMARAVEGREKTLKESEKRFRDLFNSITDLIYTQDLDGRFISVNPAMSKTFGYEHGELVGRKASEFMKPELRPLFESDYVDTIKREGYYEGVSSYFSKDGRKIYIEYRSSLV